MLKLGSALLFLYLVHSSLLQSTPRATTRAPSTLRKQISEVVSYLGKPITAAGKVIRNMGRSLRNSTEWVTERVVRGIVRLIFPFGRKKREISAGTHPLLRNRRHLYT
ncbi:uncharacterized protein LOC135127910 [Zophobas morio]|uniref:uncharacterized protein LOC135127910 n=1 Tax=Zophobas morio TaxID=2755281 RepID=UPI003082C109